MTWWGIFPLGVSTAAAVPLSVGETVRVVDAVLVSRVDVVVSLVVSEAVRVADVVMVSLADVGIVSDDPGTIDIVGEYVTTIDVVGTYRPPVIDLVAIYEPAEEEIAL